MVGHFKKRNIYKKILLIPWICPVVSGSQSLNVLKMTSPASIAPRLIIQITDKIYIRILGLTYLVNCIEM